MSYLEGSGVAVKKWMQGRLVSLGRRDTMLPVVQKPSESMQMPLGLSLKMDIITSAVTEPEARDGVKEQQNRCVLESSLREMSRVIFRAIGVVHPHHCVVGGALCLPCSAVWPSPSWLAGSRG